MTKQTLSIVVVTYNSGSYIDACLESLEGAKAEWTGEMQLLVVDNASTDDTVERVSRRLDVVLIRNHHNLGYAAAANHGIGESSGQWVMVLNPDTTCESSFIQELMGAVAPYRAHLINPLILCPDGSVNSAGLKVHYTGISTCYGLGTKPAIFAQRDLIPVGSPSGAAIIAHRHVWEDLGGFDEDYFLYMEDVDLGLRAQRLGYDCICLPKIHMYHDYRFRLSPQKLYFLERNRLLLLQKLYSKDLQRRIVWGLRLATLLAGGYAATRGWTYWQAFLEAHRWIRRRTKESANPNGFETLLPAMDTHLPVEATGDSRIAQVVARIANVLFHRLTQEQVLAK